MAWHRSAITIRSAGGHRPVAAIAWAVDRQEGPAQVDSFYGLAPYHSSSRAISHSDPNLFTHGPRDSCLGPQPEAQTVCADCFAAEAGAGQFMKLEHTHADAMQQLSC
jgi:hypothetical protein